MGALAMSTSDCCGMMFLLSGKTAGSKRSARGSASSVSRSTKAGMVARFRRRAAQSLGYLVRERSRQTLFDERGRLLPLRGRDEVRGAELIVRAPAAPVRQLFHGLAELRFVRDRLQLWLFADYGRRPIGIAQTRKPRKPVHHKMTANPVRRVIASPLRVRLGRAKHVTSRPDGNAIDISRLITFSVRTWRADVV